MHPFLRALIFLLTLLVVAAIAAGGAFLFVKRELDRAGPLNTSTVLTIPKGEGVSAIADRLEREGIIRDRRLFIASVIYFKAQPQLKAGEYEIKRNASMRQVLDALVEGKSLLRKVTIPEGLTSLQIVRRLLAEPDLVGEIVVVPPEGTLLPETYKVSTGTTRQEVIDRMRNEQQKFLNRMWAQRDPSLPLKSPEEAIVLASIVEKETGRGDERARVASVFHNRLKKSMRLQSDPTIIYGISGGEGPLGRPILREEIDAPNPYNTYQIDGLPPTAIANPGRAAIEATLNPARTGDLYFVADGTGGHVFSTNLNEHNRNVVRWRVIEKKMREEAEARLAAEQAALGATGAGAQVDAAGPKPGEDVPLPSRKPKRRGRS